MSDRLDRVRLTVREIVHRVDTPVITGAVVVIPFDTIHNGVAHVHVIGCHIDPEAATLLPRPGIHPPAYAGKGRGFLQ